MVTRRDFLKYTMTGFALSTVGNKATHAMSNIDQIIPNGKNCGESQRDIPVISMVDVVVMGGGARGVEAAVAAAKNGAKVFLVAELSYLGDEICGTLSQYEELNVTPKNISSHYCYGLEGTLKTKIAAKALGESQTPQTPMAIKTVLENELLDNNVEFLYNSMFTNVLVDSSNRVSGVVITNRSGRQAIKAKAVIDATHTAEVAKAAGAKVKNDSSNRVDFTLRVIGNSNMREVVGSKVKILPHAAVCNGKSYKVSSYTLTENIDTHDYSEIMNVEQRLRDYTFDADQVGCSDLVDYIPPYTIECKATQSGEFRGVRELPTMAFEPKGVEGVTIVGLCGDCSKDIRKLLTVAELMLLGEIIGTYVARQVAERSLSQTIKVLVNNKPTEYFGAIKETLVPLRPKHEANGFVSSGKGSLPILGRYDVVVMGGGTAGSPAAISSAEHGAKTLVLEQLHGLGGTQTFGMIGRYWDGYRGGYTKVIDKGIVDIAPIDHPRQKKNYSTEANFDWRVEWYRREIRKNGGDIWFGVVGCGAVVKDARVTGIVVTTPFGRGVVLCKLLIDSTGSADIAINAGAAYNYIDKNTPAVQGAGLPKIDLGDHYNNTDWAFIDDCDILDVTRLFVQGKKKYQNKFDLGKLPQTRERRRVVGEYMVTTFDVINHTTYEDTISFHKSSFDTHGVTINPLFTLSPPERRHVIYQTDVPLRSLLPKGLDGIIVTGLGACAERDAMPIIRMQPCLQNQGYSVGYLAATAIKEGKSVRNVDIKKIQRYLVEIGNLPERVLKEKNSKPFSDKVLSNAVLSVVDNYKGAEILLTQPQKTVKLINKQILNGVDKEKLFIYASITSILGDGKNADVIARHLDDNSWDNGWHYTGMGQFGECMGRVDSAIIALGNSKRNDLLDVIIDKASQLEPRSFYSHIRAVCEAFEAMNDKRAVDTLYDMLMIAGMQHHEITTYLAARQQVNMYYVDVLNRNQALKELTIARALYKCGDKNGLGKRILELYANGLEGVYSRFAQYAL